MGSKLTGRCHGHFMSNSRKVTIDWRPQSANPNFEGAAANRKVKKAGLALIASK